MPKDITGKYRDFELLKPDGTPLPFDEPVFILRAQDILAPIAVMYYAGLYEVSTGDLRHAAEIRMFARNMTTWPTRKLPD